MSTTNSCFTHSGLLDELSLTLKVPTPFNQIDLKSSTVKRECNLSYAAVAQLFQTLLTTPLKCEPTTLLILHITIHSQQPGSIPAPHNNNTRMQRQHPLPSQRFQTLFNPRLTKVLLTSVIGGHLSASIPHMVTYDVWVLHNYIDDPGCEYAKPESYTSNF